MFMGNHGGRRRGNNHEVGANIMKCPKCKHIFSSQINIH